MSLDINRWETVDERLAREKKERESRKGRRALRANEKQLDRRVKARRLLARMAPELELARDMEIDREEKRSRTWFIAGFPKANRSVDTLRFISRGPGWKWFHGYERPVRRLTGNRNGSEKSFDQPVMKKLLPRNNFRQMNKRELQEELASIAEQESALMLAKLDNEMKRDYVECFEWELRREEENNCFDDN